MSAAALALVFTAALLHAPWNVVATKTGGAACFATRLLGAVCGADAVAALAIG